MRRISGFLFIITASLAGGHSASTQQVAPGGRVRLTAFAAVASREPVVGSVLEVNDTALVVRWDRAPQDPLNVPFRAITELEVS
ncbi:MAG: hypothetical protein JWM27_3537 [Gemmatimonadetes bacterium]|nr:hypothetical protein [Gemmatimonadota bacterium]